MVRVHKKNNNKTGQRLENNQKEDKTDKQVWGMPSSEVPKRKTYLKKKFLIQI